MLGCVGFGWLDVGGLDVGCWLDVGWLGGVFM